MPQLNSKLRCGLNAFLRDDKAATAIEYAIIAATAGIVLVAAMGPLRDAPLWNIFQTITDFLNGLTSP